MFLSSFADLWRIIVVGFFGYLSLILVLRIAGKRTLSKMNAFDLVVTVALGSILATTLLNKKVSLFDGITAFVTLSILQFIVAWLSTRSKTFSNFIKSQPQLLYFKDDYLKQPMNKERITENEILQATRSQGISSMEAVKAVVLESDGSLSVLKKTQEETEQALKNVRK
ncbi:uncharacterized membrane protein YcaP (DUF421 family) [Metabacillus crassostreae]|uniref:DUF421 domain-containing protein n=1 Tax=Metabacillus crassostreae TaxID=929098 RepID=UPI001958C105|nr:YetF domain-containing protein [Metabacillus crassostreae]MBM7604891.1 uncharacterized membrane protein YcaP (DUF421 family) [Metabacillus crassostreae]